MKRPKNIVIVGFTKCGTRSLEHYLYKKHGKYRKFSVIRTENTYEETKKGFLLKNVWADWKVMAITRKPIDRIHSAHQTLPGWQDHTIEELINSELITQSHYDFYIKKLAKKYGVEVDVVRLEDMIKLPDFPHINESPEKNKWSKEDYDKVQNALDKAGIKYGN